MPPMRTSGVTADPAVRAKVLEGVPLERAGEVDEVANAVLFLASDEASYITGAELYVMAATSPRNRPWPAPCLSTWPT